MKRISMRRAPLLLVPLFLFACDREPVAPDLEARRPEPSSIINGVPDGDGHPNVGVLLRDKNGDGEVRYNEMRCSGALIAPDVFLTCAPALPAGMDLYVSFAQNQRFYPIPGLIKAEKVIVHPRNEGKDPYDLAVVILPPGSTTGITPVKLPPLGYLDKLAAKGGLRGMWFDNVGYGYQFLVPRDGRSSANLPGERLTSSNPFMSLSPTWLGLLKNANVTGQGGDCFGDAGGPKFIAGTDTVVATGHMSDAVCVALARNWRLDTEETRSFLKDYVTLP